ncbi:retrovirus-related pol polyprotein from transposon TNT 1-94 [Tanacetum coccineum]
MVNLSHYGSDALAEIKSGQIKSVNDTLTAELERYKEQVNILKEGQNVDLKSNDTVSDSSSQSVEIDRLKQKLSGAGSNIDREIALEKKIKQLDNIVFKRDQSAQTVHMLTKPQFFYDHTTKQALVSLRKPTALENETPKPVVTLVYSRKPRKSKTNVPISKSKVLKSVSANKKEPSHLGDPLKDESLDFIIKFLKMIQVRLKVPVRRIRTDNGTKFVNQTLREYYEKSAARTMLIYAKAPLFLWAEAVATACYTQNRSIIRLRHGKTPYELLHDKPPDLSFFHVFGALCYPTNDSENFGRLQSQFRTRTLMKTTLQKSVLRLVPNPPPSTPFVPPLRTDWDILFQPLFDELLTPLLTVDHPAPEVIVPIAEVVAPVPAVSTGSPSSTNVDQDAPSPNELGRYSKNKASISGSWGYVKKRKLILKSLFAPVAKIKAIRICLGNLPLKSNRSSTIIGCFKTAFLAHMVNLLRKRFM